MQLYLYEVNQIHFTRWATYYLSKSNIQLTQHGPEGHAL